MGRTAPLTSKRCILYIYSTNIGTEYFKHALYSPFLLSSKCSLFHNANLFRSRISHILYTGCAKIKKNNSGAKGLRFSVLSAQVRSPHYLTKFLSLSWAEFYLHGLCAVECTHVKGRLSKLTDCDRTDNKMGNIRWTQAWVASCCCGKDNKYDIFWVSVCSLIHSACNALAPHNTGLFISPWNILKIRNK